MPGTSVMLARLIYISNDVILDDTTRNGKKPPRAFAGRLFKTNALGTVRWDGYFDTE